MAPTARNGRGLQKAASAAGQQTLSFWVKRGAAPSVDTRCEADKENCRERSPRRSSPQKQQESTVPTSTSPDKIEPTSPLNESAQSVPAGFGLDSNVMTEKKAQEAVEPKKADQSPLKGRAAAKKATTRKRGIDGEATPGRSAKTQRRRAVTPPARKDQEPASGSSESVSAAVPESVQPPESPPTTREEGNTVEGSDLKDDAELAAASATAAAGKSTLRQRLARGGLTPPPAPGKGIAEVAPAKEKLKKARWPPTAPVSSPPKSWLPGLNTESSPSGLEDSSSPAGEQVATPCRTRQSSLGCSPSQDEDLPSTNHPGITRRFGTPPPAPRQVFPPTQMTPTPPSSQGSAGRASSGKATDSPQNNRDLGTSPPQAAEASSEPKRTAGERTQPSTTSSSSSATAAGSVKELKALLAEYKVDFTGCVEKAELQQLWNRFEELKSKPLAELRASCVAAGIPAVSARDPVESARLLLSKRSVNSKPSGSASTMSTSSSTPASSSSYSPFTHDSFSSATSSSSSPTVARVEEESASSASAVNSTRRLREEEAAKEIARILQLRRESFGSHAAWARSVLGLARSAVAATSLDVGEVQQAFRTMMRKLHPDRIGASDRAANAMEMLREARHCLERSLSQLQPPHPPKSLRATTLCAAPGRRRIKLEWSPPDWLENAPVRRYLVAALDPSYGRALTITVLEPDYSEELGRFIPVEELGSYILAEEELKKMPSLFRQPSATVQVAAANEAGQSTWATLHVSLRQAESVPAGASAPGQANGRAGAAGTAVTAKEIAEFEAQAKLYAKQSKDNLCTWLRKQSKPLLVAWLKKKSWPTLGTKDELVDRVAFAVGASQ
eukprot:TRINITY_DN108670_c0_g1_i1.p1 TRINITY_DN108670_c0_g1~~TRINITY_DN108670_c0_g1_i1.p1  ORF type:complete len:844 (+),score=208.56 TRINITY_DN108670_c0_g1_i1:109-2640(+)